MEHLVVIIAAMVSGGLVSGVTTAWLAPGRRRKDSADAALSFAKAAETLIAPLQTRVDTQGQRIAALEAEVIRLEKEVATKEDAVIRRDARVAVLTSELGEARARLAKLEEEVRRLGGDPENIGRQY